MKTSNIKYSFLIFICLANCSSKDSNKEDFTRLTGFIDMMDVNNRIELLPIVLNYYNNEDEIEKASLEMFYVLDSAYSEILISSGGYDMNGNMVGGQSKGLANQVLIDRRVIEKLKALQKNIENIAIQKRDNSSTMKSEHTKNAIYPISESMSSAELENLTTAEILMYIMVAENKLISTLLIN